MSFKDYKRGANRTPVHLWNALETADAAGRPMWSNAHKKIMFPTKTRRIHPQSAKGQAIIESLRQRRLLRVEKKSKD